VTSNLGDVGRAVALKDIVVARAGIEPATFRFSGGGEVKRDEFVLAKLDELDHNPGFRARDLNGAADAKRMKRAPDP